MARAAHRVLVRLGGSVPSITNHVLPLVMLGRFRRGFGLDLPQIVKN